MDNNQTINTLKAHHEGISTPKSFKSYEHFTFWIDNISPWLKFNNNYYTNFVSLSDVARNKKLSSLTVTPCINKMISIVNQAIIELENDITETTTESKPTLQTLKKEENKSDSHWYQKPYGIIILMVIAGLIIYAIKMLITHFFITPS